MARTRRRQAQAPAQRLILDSGAVIAAADVLTSDADDLRALLAGHPSVMIIPL